MILPMISLKEKRLNHFYTLTNVMERIKGYGVMRMPALMINKKVVTSSKVLKAKDVEKLL